MAIFVREKSFYKTLVLLAIPIILQNVITFCVGFADNIMIGSLGDYAISGVYMANQVQTLLQMFILGIAGAMQVISTQYWGKRDIKSIKIITAIAFRFAIAVSLLLLLAALFFPSKVLGIFTGDKLVIAEGIKFLKYVCYSYVFFAIAQLLISSMRSVETVRIGMYVSIVTLVTDVFLNWLLIFGNMGMPKLGVEGAGIATLVSRIAEAGVMVVYVGFIDKKIHLKLKDMLLRDHFLLKDYLKYGLPVIGGQLVWAANMLGSGAIIGHLNAEAIASMSMTNMLNHLLYIWSLGLSAAVGIIAGKTVGAGEYEKMKLYAKTMQVIFLGMGLASGLIVFLLRDPFLSLYNVSDNTMAVARQFMAVLSFTMIGQCYQAPSLGGLVRAGGDTSFVFKNDAIFVFLVVLPSALIAMYVFHAAAWVIYACLKCDQILKCFVAIVKINRFNWMKNLTRKRDTQLEAAAE